MSGPFIKQTELKNIISKFPQKNVNLAKIYFLPSFNKKRREKLRVRRTRITVVTRK